MTVTPDLFTSAPEAAGSSHPGSVATGDHAEVRQLPAPALEVWVDGTAQPKGSKTAVLRGKKIVQIEAVDFNNDGAPLAAWSGAVAMGLRTAWASRPALDETVTVAVEFRRRRPQSARSWQLYAATKPDADKLVRAIGDALQKAGVLRDDSRIADLRAVKRLCPKGAEPGVRIRVWPLGEWERTGWTVHVPDHPLMVREAGAA